MRSNERMNLSGASGTPLAACLGKRHAHREQQAARRPAASAADAPAGYARRYVAVSPHVMRTAILFGFLLLASSQVLAACLPEPCSQVVLKVVQCLPIQVDDSR